MSRPLYYTLQRLKHLNGRDLLAAAVDELLQAPRQREVTLRVQLALVPGVEPAACGAGACAKA